jgi:hypothetical protein
MNQMSRSLVPRLKLPDSLPRYISYPASVVYRNNVKFKMLSSHPWITKSMGREVLTFRISSRLVNASTDLVICTSRNDFDMTSKTNVEVLTLFFQENTGLFPLPDISPN